MHYYITFMPILVVPTAWLLNGLYVFLKDKKVSEFTSSFVIDKKPKLIIYCNKG